MGWVVAGGDDCELIGARDEKIKNNNTYHRRTEKKKESHHFIKVFADWLCLLFKGEI